MQPSLPSHSDRSIRPRIEAMLAAGKSIQEISVALRITPQWVERVALSLTAAVRRKN